MSVVSCFYALPCNKYRLSILCFSTIDESHLFVIFLLLNLNLSFFGIEMMFHFQVVSIFTKSCYFQHMYFKRSLVEVPDVFLKSFLNCLQG